MYPTDTIGAGEIVTMEIGEHSEVVTTEMLGPIGKTKMAEQRHLPLKIRLVSNMRIGIKMKDLMSQINARK